MKCYILFSSFRNAGWELGELAASLSVVVHLIALEFFVYHHEDTTVGGVAWFLMECAAMLA